MVEIRKDTNFLKRWSDQKRMMFTTGMQMND